MSDKVRLSKESIEILSNVSSIKNQIRFRRSDDDKPVRTLVRVINEQKTVIFDGSIPEVFPEDFSIYLLDKFLSVFSLSAMSDAELNFGAGDRVTFKSGDVTIDYYFTEEAAVPFFDKDLAKLPPPDFGFEITAGHITALFQAAKLLGHSYLKVQVKDGVVSLQGTNLARNGQAKFNDYKQVVGTVEYEDAQYFIPMANVSKSLMPMDFDVKVIAGQVLKFVSKSRDACFILTTAQVND